MTEPAAVVTAPIGPDAPDRVEFRTDPPATGTGGWRSTARSPR